MTLLFVLINPELSLNVKKKKCLCETNSEKDSDLDILNAYRPFYNTSFFVQSKGLCLHLQQLLKHLNDFDCLPQFQTEYRQFHSVETALCRVNNDLLHNETEGKSKKHWYNLISTILVQNLLHRQNFQINSK